MSEPAIGYRCPECRHIRADYSCDAYPEGMPWEIINGFDHAMPLAGDRGIRFEPRGEGDVLPVFVSLMPRELIPSGIPEQRLD